MWMWVPVRFHSSVSVGVCPYKTKYARQFLTLHTVVPTLCPVFARAPTNKLGPCECIPSKFDRVQASCDWHACAIAPVLLDIGHRPMAKTNVPLFFFGLGCGRGSAAATALKQASAADAEQPAFRAARSRRRPPTAALNPAPSPQPLSRNNRLS